MLTSSLGHSKTLPSWWFACCYPILTLLHINFLDKIHNHTSLNMSFGKWLHHLLILEIPVFFVLSPLITMLVRFFFWSCQLQVSCSHLERGNLTKELFSSTLACRQVCADVFKGEDSYGKTQVWCPFWAVVQGCIGKQTEQARKQLSSLLATSVLPPASCLALSSCPNFPSWWAVTCNEISPLFLRFLSVTVFFTALESKLGQYLH